jgi:spore photoproduct lyase
MENTGQTDNLEAFPLFASLPETERQFLIDIHRKHRFTYQQSRLLVEQAADLALWEEIPLSHIWDETLGGHLEGKMRTKVILDHALAHVLSLRRCETDYADFSPPEILPTKPRQIVESHMEETLLGRCPCPVSGEKTRCCNLNTLDVVKQCGFACSYCSIQSFYHSNEVVFMNNLETRLDALELDAQTWHIGTGQASDSLMWGDDNGILTSLARFARKHPQVALELKTKSARTDWLGKVVLPKNILATWSLNAPTIIDREEHLCATLDQRLAAARKVADHGVLVGFHLHPLVYFKGWQTEYRHVVEKIVSLFTPEEVVLISLGTLTFTRQVLRQLRSSGKPSRILEMELVETAGKFSYPVSVKKTMFSHVAQSFPSDWLQDGGPFFYLCMELPELWEPVLKRSYPDNASFEADMRKSYMGKIERLRMNCR